MPSSHELALATLVIASGTRADVAATGAFGIDIDVPFPFTSGTVSGRITGFDAGTLAVGGAPVNLATTLGAMNIVNGIIPSINVPALAANFSLDAVSGPLGFSGAGIAVCSSNIIPWAAGEPTLVGQFPGLSDGSKLLPDGQV